MKQSLYRKAMFALAAVCLFLLAAVAVRLNIFSIFMASDIFRILDAIFANTYVSGILCSVLSVILIYIAQVRYSKRMLKKDFRCQEVMQDIYDGIEEYCNILDKIPTPSEWNSEEDYREKQKQDAQMYYEFYAQNKVKIDFITSIYLYKNNQILLDSVQSCFLINLNFKLLDILNNIKNRLPNLQEEYPELAEDYQAFHSSGDETALIHFGTIFPHYLTDLQFMTIYWKRLLDYLKFDPTFIKLFVEAYRSKYDIVEDLKQPPEILKRKNKEIEKEVRRALRRYHIRHFWDH